ncbi:MAG TPA: ion transporter [Polyangiales bacterium]|nr:ion transporter [Polyangiales bacterium]
MPDVTSGSSKLRARTHEIVFEADTAAGRAFDIGSMIAILVSIAAVVLESIGSVRARYGEVLRALEWVLTGLFTVDYALRLVSVHKPLRYVTSFYGLVDLMSVLPSYLSLIWPGSQSLLVIRSLRLLRIFRVLKLVRFSDEAKLLRTALAASKPKITVFLFAVLTIVLIMGALIYVVEGPEHGFTSIPRGIYWAIVTLTTVGYGDLFPKTDLGRLLASVVMIMGYAIIAVPTGIVTVELTAAMRKRTVSTQACPNCAAEGHDFDAVHCKFCGSKL